MKKAFRNIPDMEQNYYIDGDKLKEEQSLFDTSVCPKKIIASVIFSVFLVIIQETFFNDLRLLGVKPNLTLVVVLIISSLSTPRFSMVYGLLTGLYLDVIYGRYLGLYAMLFAEFCNTHVKSTIIHQNYYIRSVGKNLIATCFNIFFDNIQVCKHCKKPHNCGIFIVVSNVASGTAHKIPSPTLKLGIAVLF